jgi:hypothetical protein
MTEKSTVPSIRRRGEQLEAELLDAAWKELAEAGYANLTMESVASRARTGVAVLYRRWNNKAELVLAALANFRVNHPVELPDTGTLRGDMLVALVGMGEAQAGFFAIAMASAKSGLLVSAGLSPNEFRERIIGPQQLKRVDMIYDRAHQRGEINLRDIPSTVLAMPFDLVRHDLLMGAEPVSHTRILAIVDDLFLPLLALASKKSENG